MKKSWNSIWLGICLSFALAAAGCAGKGAPMKMTAGGPGKKTVAIEASNFEFKPSSIQTLKGDTLVLKISNTSSTVHNFTIKNLKGGVLKSVELPGNQTVSVEIAFPEVGIYEFYCDKTFHSTMGMKGSVEALRAP
jgi:plastocyanin